MTRQIKFLISLQSHVEENGVVVTLKDLYSETVHL